jgi:hypothetical protein
MHEAKNESSHTTHRRALSHYLLKKGIWHDKI